MSYSVSKEELLSLASRIYEEGCYGYLDLKNSACDRIISDFIGGKKEIKDVVTNITSHREPFYSANYGTSVVRYVVDGTSNATIDIMQTN